MSLKHTQNNRELFVYLDMLRNWQWWLQVGVGYICVCVCVANVDHKQQHFAFCNDNNSNNNSTHKSCQSDDRNGGISEERQRRSWRPKAEQRAVRATEQNY